VARAIALRRLSTAPQTRAQLDTAMAKAGVPHPVRDRVLDRFDEVGLIDDTEFSQAWVESRHRGRGLGRRALAHELRTRGVDDHTIAEAVAAIDDDAEAEAARRLVQRKLAATRGLDPTARTRRLAAMLARKGYPAGLAFRVIRDELATEGVDDSHLLDEPPS
jgi:regulatory protein